MRRRLLRILIAPVMFVLTSAAATAAGAADAAQRNATISSARLTSTYEGIEFQYSPRREDLVRLLARRFAEHNAAVMATAGNAVKTSVPAWPLSATEMRLHRTAYLTHLAAQLGMTMPTPLQQECYDAFVDNYTMYMGLYDAMRTVASQLQMVRRVTVWDRAEMVQRLEAGEKVPGFTWDPATQQGNVQYGVSLQPPNSDTFKQIIERRKQLHRDYRMSISSEKSNTVYRGHFGPKDAKQTEPVSDGKSSAVETTADRTELFPIIIPADLADKTPSEQAAALWTETKPSIAAILKYVSDLAERIPTSDPGLAFIVLHETTEIGVIDRYMRGPDRRWFCDGVANYVAWRVVRDLHGTEIAKTVYDLPAQLARFAPLREQADLRRWPAVENESAEEQNSELDLARYAFATQAVTLMVDRGGDDLLPRLFRQIGRTNARRADLQTVAKAWTKLTGEDLDTLVAQSRPLQPAK